MTSDARRVLGRAPVCGEDFWDCGCCMHCCPDNPGDHSDDDEDE